MLRVYSGTWDGGAELPPLAPDEAHHLARVRRVRAGEPVELLNGRGAIGRCGVSHVAGGKVALALREVTHAAPPPVRIHLLVAPPLGKAFAGLLHKAVELGVGEITPLVTAHAEAVAGRAENKREHWEAVLVEALKQSGNPWLPSLHPPAALAAALARDGAARRLCAALQPDAEPLWAVIERQLERRGTIEVYIGPEGDFSPEEYRQMRQAGCLFVSLGPLVLKVETAASLTVGALALWNRLPD